MFHHHRALRGPLSTLLTLATLVVTPMAMAGGGDMDFAAEAKRRMNLSFDLDEVEGMLQQEIPLAYSSVAVAPLPLEPNSEMAAVTVFRDRALVTRVLEERAKPGDGSKTLSLRARSAMRRRWTCHNASVSALLSSPARRS